MLFALPSAAAPPDLYHSPADDGVSGGLPATVPSGQPVELHLYLGVGATASTDDPCHQGDGDELCGYLLRLAGTGMALQSFTPADADTLFNLSAGALELTGGDVQQGELGPTKVGDLVVDGSEGAQLELSEGDFVTTVLAKEETAARLTIVELPEPGGVLGLVLGVAALPLLGRRRRAGPRRPRCTALALTGLLGGTLLPAGPAGAVEVVFGPEQTVTQAASRVLNVEVADMDGDGDLDLLSASFFDDKLAWYENTDGTGSFGPQQVISTATRGAFDIYPADIDGDGDLDVISASQDDDQIAWYENTDGAGSFGPLQSISTQAAGANRALAADVDGDGDLDVLSASRFDTKIAWYENTDGAGSFGAQQVITPAATGAYAVEVADIDGDGDLDVLSAERADDAFNWFENTDGAGSFGPAQSVSTSADGARAIWPADLDGDGDVDLIGAAYDGDSVAWYENTDGAGTFGGAQAIATGVDGPRHVQAADVDADGDLDVLVALDWDNAILWLENTDGAGVFGPPQVLSTTSNRAVTALPADLDGDGDLDVAAGSRDDDTVAWFENQTIHRSGAWSRAGAVTTSADVAQFVFAADVDGDGDLDALSASAFDDTIAWYENTDGLGSFGPPRTITTGAAGARCVFAADVDGDGDVDALSARFDDDTIAWYENTDDLGSFGPPQTITTSADGALSVFAADVDDDDDLDVLSASINDDTIAWYENTDGLGSFGSPETITTGANGANSVFAADVDGDGDVDALSASAFDNTIAWYENTDGLGSFGPPRTITTSAFLAQSVFAADVDGDGDLDALSASEGDDTIAWYENTDSLGSFGPPQIITAGADGAAFVFAADMDGDGDVDALSASADDDTIAWYENADGLGSFGPPPTVTTSADLAHSVFAADVDGDGDVDALSASVIDDTVAWYENSDGLGSFGPPQVITTGANGANSVFAADVDGDGDVDALSASATDDTIAWYENTDGQGSFGPAQIITTNADGALTMFAADVDGDGDVDALSASLGDDTIAWYENTDGLGNFGPPQIITTGTAGAQSVFTADVDGDGDLDALSASRFDHTIAWSENTDALGSFGPPQIITASADDARSVFAADVDGDGDVDALSASVGDDTIAWYENADGLGSFGPPQIITTGAAGARSVFAADVDGDGDLDALSASLDDDTIAWYENTDGLGSFGPPQIITASADAAWSVVSADVDGDGDLDALTASAFDDKIAWYANRSGQVAIATSSTTPPFALPAEQLEALRIELRHLGRAGDADAELATIALLLDGAPQSPLASDPTDPLTSAEANALIEKLLVYRDEGSGELEPGSDALVATVGTLSLSSGVLSVALPDADPDVQVAPGSSGLFFVVAELSASAGSADPRRLRLRHLSSHSEVQHAGSAIVLSQAPGRGTQPQIAAVLDPTADDDGDGLANGDEVTIHGTNPLLADSEQDGLSDADEVNVHGTDPLLADTDGDGLADGEEVNVRGTDPLLADSDGDGLSDGDEVNAHGTAPLVADTDGDGLSDGDEVNVHGTDPLVASDADGDGIPDADEVARGMHPLLEDTDGDGVLDDTDNCPSAYNPLQEDQGGLGTATPDGVGDLCQNGDFDGNGEVDVLDATLERRALIGLEPALDPALPPSTP